MTPVKRSLNGKLHAHILWACVLSQLLPENLGKSAIPGLACHRSSCKLDGYSSQLHWFHDAQAIGTPVIARVNSYPAQYGP